MNTQYAGFWLRFVAVIIDGLILGVVYFVLITPLLGVLGFGMAHDMQNFDPSDEAQTVSMAGKFMAFAGVAQIISLTVQTLYYAFMESSKYQASVGKLVLGLKVTDMNGQKLDFTKAFIRSISKIISAMILLIGYIMAGFTEKKQALHDIIAGTLVVKK